MIRIVPTKFGDAVTSHAYSLPFDMIGPMGEETYRFYFRYSRRAKRWVLNIENSLGDLAVVGATVVQGVNLLDYAKPGLQPRGFLVCVWQTGGESAPEPEEKDLGLNSQIIYFERAEDLESLPPKVPVRA